MWHYFLVIMVWSLNIFGVHSRNINNSFSFTDLNEKCSERILTSIFSNTSVPENMCTDMNSLEDYTSKLCGALYYQLSDICAKSKSVGLATPPPKDQECIYIKNQWPPSSMQCPKEVDSLCQKVKQESPETMFEACTEVCQNNKNGRTPDNRICLSLVLSMQLNTRKMGENGAGIMKKPVSKDLPDSVNKLPPTTPAPAIIEPEITKEIPEKPKIDTLPQPGKDDSLDDTEQKSNASLNLFDESVIPTETNIGAEPTKVESAPSGGDGLSKVDENSFKLDDNSQNSLLPQINIPDQRIDDSEILETQSKFLNYFVYATIFCIVSYLLFHNKKKILALVLEGRRKQPSGRSRRHSSAVYHKLDNNLDEAMVSNSEDSVRHIIY